MKIDGGGLSGNISGLNISELAQKLNIGDVFRAKIIEIAVNEVFLKLFDGSQIKASTESPLNLNLGDFVDFEVKSNEGDKLVLEVAKNKNNSTKPPELDKLLTSIGRNDSESKEIAKTLLDNNIKVTSNSIDNIKNLMQDFKSSNLTPPKAVFLMQNDVPVIKENISLLNAFLNKEFNLSGKLESLSNQISSLPENKIAQISSRLSILESMEKLPDLIAKLANFDTKLSQSQTINQDTHGAIPIETPENPSPSLKAPSTNINIEFKNAFEKLDKLIENSVLIAKDNPFEILNTDKDELEKLKKLFSNIKTADSSPVDDTTSKSPVKSTKELVRKIFDDCFIKLDNETSPEDIDVKDVYKKIIHRLHILKEATEGSTDTPSIELKSNINHFEKQVNFLNDINNHNNTFIQVPLNYEGYKSGELYIMKKKNSNRSDNPDGTTMFLSLGTVNIGRFETLVNVRDKNIKIYMRLEDEGLIDFVKKNYGIIYDLIDKTPYKIVDIKCKKIDEEINPTNLQTALKNEFIGDTKSIDYKI